MTSTALLIFALLLVAAVFLSELASRTPLSTAVLFLVAGFVVGDIAGSVSRARYGPQLHTFVELALVSVLYTDGMHLTAGAIRDHWRLPGRALLIGMPLTLTFTAALAYFIADLPWMDAWLVGAALAPTDPVFAAALVGQKQIPERVRHLLNIESGVNDGLALPVVLTLLAFAGGKGDSLVSAVSHTALGLAIGIATAWAVVRVGRLRRVGVSQDYLPTAGLAIALLVFSTAKLAGANEFLAMFSAGVTVAISSSGISRAFEPAGSLIAQALKLAAVLAFGALVSWNHIVDTTPAEWAFTAAALFIARPAALAPSLALSSLTWRERAAVAWFGPKGFASVFFGIMILGSGVPDSGRLFRLIAIVVAGSIVAHSSTDVLVSGWLQKHDRPAR